MKMGVLFVLLVVMVASTFFSTRWRVLIVIAFSIVIYFAFERGGEYGERLSKAYNQSNNSGIKSVDTDNVMYEEREIDGQVVIFRTTGNGADKNTTIYISIKNLKGE